MHIDVELLRRLENLSMLEISPQKEQEILTELNRFLDFVEIIEELDLSKEDFRFNPLNGGTPLREDTPRVDPEISREILKNAPRSADNFFVVPKIIE